MSPATDATSISLLPTQQSEACMTMKSVFVALLCLILAISSQAFQPRPATVAVTRSSSTTLNVFGNKKSAAAREAENAEKYWQGEWVCADCGYIYNRVGTVGSS